MSRSVSAPSSVTKTSPCWNGLIVPGSTLMYGSSLRLVTRMPREARIAARDAAAMPFPREETTPPVTKTNLVMDDKSRKFLFYRNASFGTNLCIGPVHIALVVLMKELYRGEQVRGLATWNGCGEAEVRSFEVVPGEVT